eukprot:g1230.t1
MPRRVALLLLTGPARGALPPREASKTLLGQRKMRIAELGVEGESSSPPALMLKSDADGVEDHHHSSEELRDAEVAGGSADYISKRNTRPSFSASAAMETAGAAEGAATTSVEHAGLLQSSESQLQTHQGDDVAEDENDKHKHHDKDEGPNKGGPCSPYKLQSEANVKNFVARLKDAEDQDGKSSQHGSTAHAELVEHMMDLSDADYQALQNALVARADKQLVITIDDATIEKALEHTKSMNLPETVMSKLRYRDGKKEGGDSEFVAQLKKTSPPALHAVLERLIEDGPDVVKDALTPDALVDVCHRTFLFRKKAGKAGQGQGENNECEEISERLANLNDPAFRAVLAQVQETSGKMQRLTSGHLSEAEKWTLGQELGAAERSSGGSFDTSLVTKPFSHVLTRLSSNIDFTKLVEDPTQLQPQLENVGKTFDAMVDPKNIKDMFSAEGMAKLSQNKGVDAVAKKAVGVVDHLVAGAVESDAVNQNVVNKQLGDMAQQMTSDFVGNAWAATSGLIKVAVPEAAPVLTAMEALGLSDFVQQTLPKLLRLTFDAMFEHGPSWLRAYVINSGGFSGAMNLFFKSLATFSPKGAQKITKSFKSLSTAKFWENEKCSWQVLKHTWKQDQGRPLWDKSQEGAVACAEEGVQYGHLAMPDPADPLRRRELPATTEKNWMACRARCFEMVRDHGINACTFFNFWQKHKRCYLLNADSREAHTNFDSAEWATGTADGVRAGHENPILSRVYSSVDNAGLVSWSYHMLGAWDSPGAWRADDANPDRVLQPLAEQLGFELLSETGANAGSDKKVAAQVLGCPLIPQAAETAFKRLFQDVVADEMKAPTMFKCLRLPPNRKPIQHQLLTFWTSAESEHFIYARDQKLEQRQTLFAEGSREQVENFQKALRGNSDWELLFNLRAAVAQLLDPAEAAAVRASRKPAGRKTTVRLMSSSLSLADREDIGCRIREILELENNATWTVGGNKILTLGLDEFKMAVDNAPTEEQRKEVAAAVSKFDQDALLITLEGGHPNLVIADRETLAAITNKTEQAKAASRARIRGNNFANNPSKKAKLLQLKENENEAALLLDDGIELLCGKGKQKTWPAWKTTFDARLDVADVTAAMPDNSSIKAIWVAELGRIDLNGGANRLLKGEWSVDGEGNIKRPTNLDQKQLPQLPCTNLDHEADGSGSWTERNGDQAYAKFIVSHNIQGNWNRMEQAAQICHEEASLAEAKIWGAKLLVQETHRLRVSADGRSWRTTTSGGLQFREDSFAWFAGAVDRENADLNISLYIRSGAVFHEEDEAASHLLSQIESISTWLKQVRPKARGVAVGVDLNLPHKTGSVPELLQSIQAAQRLNAFTRGLIAKLITAVAVGTIPINLEGRKTYQGITTPDLVLVSPSICEKRTVPPLNESEKQEFLQLAAPAAAATSVLAYEEAIARAMVAASYAVPREVSAAEGQKKRTAAKERKASCLREAEKECLGLKRGEPVTRIAGVTVDGFVVPSALAALHATARNFLAKPAMVKKMFGQDKNQLDYPKWLRQLLQVAKQCAPFPVTPRIFDQQELAAMEDEIQGPAGVRAK